MANARERQREKRHASLRQIEVELHNTLQGVNALVDRTLKAVKARDCKTARLDFEQATLAFRAIARKLSQADALYRLLRLSPGEIQTLQADARAASVDVHTAAPAKKPASVDVHTAPAKKAAKKAAKKPAKKGKR